MKQLSMFGIIGGAALLIAAPFSLQWSHTNVGLSLDSAEAQIGQPTATSVAGVSRRVHRRAYRRAVDGTAVAGVVDSALDTAPSISLHQPDTATTYHLTVTRHLIATVSRVRSAPAAGTTALLPKAEVHRRFYYVANVPTPAVSSRSKMTPYSITSVGAGEHRRRNLEVERFGCFEVND